MQLGEDGFGRHKHQRQILRFAGNQILGGNIVDMLREILAHPRCGLLALILGLGFTPGGDGLERKFCIDRQRAAVR